MDEIPESRLQQFREAFEQYDKDNNGSITLRELSIVMNSINLNNDFTQNQINSLMEKAGDSNTGKIKVEDFLSIMSAKYKDTDTAEEIISAFRTFDKEGNGIISSNELRHIMITLGERLSDEEVDEIIREADINGDGFIYYEDFVKSMLSK